MRVLLAQGMFAALVLGLSYNFVSSSKLTDDPASASAASGLPLTTASSPHETDEETPLSDEQLEALLAGADPTTLLPPTAAGRDIRPSPTCRTGQIEMPDDNPAQLNGSYYLALEIDQYTYIQPLPFSPTTLVQAPFQSVTADVTEQLPESVREQFHRMLTSLGNCEHRPLYLSSVKRGSAI